MSVPRPYALLAEITYRCPLHCPYCSNPTLTRGDQELRTNEWARVIREAAALGVLQIGFSGGEPLARPDLADLVRVAREANLYTNLITSGIGLDDDQTQRLLFSVGDLGWAHRSAWPSLWPSRLSLAAGLVRGDHSRHGCTARYHTLDSSHRYDDAVERTTRLRDQ